MNPRKALFLTGVACLLALSALAQMGRMAPPTVSGVWKPEVGSGAAYKIEGRRSGNAEMEVAVVGTEPVKDKTGNWVETAIKMDQGQMLSKTLVLVEGKHLQVKRVIMQMPGQGPMDMTEMMEISGMGGMRDMGNQTADAREGATYVGPESVTTPAGTFACEHFRTKDGADVWISETVKPYAMVKMTGKDGSMTLVRVITGAKSRITGPVKKFDPEGTMRRPPQ